MTQPFSLAQKLRILVNHRALVAVDGEWVAIARFAFGTMNAASRWRRLRRAGCAVKCGCGCGIWARLEDIQFDHERQHAAGGSTVIANGRPLRTAPCHAAKSASEQAVTGWVVSVRRKFRVRDKEEMREARQGAARSAWASRTRGLLSRALQSRPFPKRFEVRS